jgi:hypothetical protein
MERIELLSITTILRGWSGTESNNAVAIYWPIVLALGKRPRCLWSN